MAIAQQTSRFGCSGPDCTQEFTEREAVDGSYCSRECSLRDDGDALLADIKHDHRWCHGCFRQCKEIEKPGSEHSVVIGPVDHDAVADTCRDVLVGYQFLTEHGRHGEREGRGIVDVEPVAADQNDASRTPDRAPSPAESLVMTGTICECGTTEHRDDYLRREDLTSVRAAAKRLCRALVWTAHEGQNDKTVDARRLARTLRQTAAERGEWDWKLAVGRAIDAD